MKMVIVKLYTVHVNRVEYRTQPMNMSSKVNRPTTNVMETWNQPQTDHIVIPCDVNSPSNSSVNCNTSQCRYPLCNNLLTIYNYKLGGKLLRWESVYSMQT